MKKLFAIIVVSFLLSSISAEEFLNESFDTWIPDGWSVIEGSGSEYYSHWWQNDSRACVFVTNDNQDEWLITPEITLPSSGEFRLSADMMGSYYRMVTMDWGDLFVNVSTDNGETWETIWVEDDQDIVEASGVVWPWQSNTWFFPSVNINDYAGETIIIAFRYISPDDEADWWNIDNVIVKSLTENEVVLEEFLFPEYGLVNDVFSFEGTYRNLGENDVTSFEAVYAVNGIESASYLIEDVVIPYNATYNFTHDIPYTFTEAEIYNLYLKISKVNGMEDPLPENNIIDKDITIATETVSRKPLFEMFTSSTCAPCSGANEVMDAVLENNPDNTYSLVKYQVDWPGIGDPYYIEDCGIRVDYYGIQAAPSLVVNGSKDYSAYNFNQSKFNQATAEEAYVEMSLVHTFDGLYVTAEITVDPRINIEDASAHIAIVEKTTYNNTGSNGETEFYNVLMAMLPDGNGTSSNLTEGVATIFSGDANLITTFIEEFDDLMLVAWIQDNQTQSILQSESHDLDVTVGIEDQMKTKVSIFPNPSSGIFTFMDAMNSSIEVCDISGAIVFKTSINQQVQRVDLSEFDKGVYFVKIIKEDEVLNVEKLILN